MLRQLSSRIVKRNFNASWNIPKSNMSKLSIPSDKEQQTGRRKEELDAEAAGVVGFNKDPIIPPVDAGTKENPILVFKFSQTYIKTQNINSTFS